MNKENLIKQTTDFLSYLTDWFESIPSLSLEEAIPRPDQTAIMSIDVINAFCTKGALASPRVARIVPHIQQLFLSAWKRGMPNILLIQECHTPDAEEFSAFPPHGICGTTEADTVEQLKALPFYDQMTIFNKNSISAIQGTGLIEWLAAHPHVDNIITVGDCTDLCTYQIAMDIRLNANAHQLKRRVILPANCVDTYDRPIKIAQSEGGFPHPADLLHLIFLYHMALNGIQVVKSID